MKKKPLVCSICGITEEERNKLPPINTGENHPIYYQTKSFYLGWDDKDHSNTVPYCPECHKEKALESCMKIMDNYAKKHGEAKLAKLFGIN